MKRMIFQGKAKAKDYVHRFIDDTWHHRSKDGSAVVVDVADVVVVVVAVVVVVEETGIADDVAPDLELTEG